MSAWSTEGVRELSLRALERLGANEVEVEVSAMYAPLFLEAADRREVLPIDTRDPAGGFGGVDLWLASLVPIFAAAQGLRQAGRLDRSTLDPLIDRLVEQASSPRARRERVELKRVVHELLGLEPG